METVFKRYFWAIHLVMLLMIAGVSAMAANNVVEGLLSPLSVTSPPPPQKVDSKPSARKPTLASSQDKDKWGKPPEPEKPEGEGEKETEETTEEPNPEDQIAEGEYPISDIPINLTGTMVAGDPQWSMALMIDTSSRASFSAKEGEEILEEGAKIVKIERDRVVVEREGRLEQIELEGDGPPKGAKKRPGLSPRKGPTSIKPKTSPSPAVSSSSRSSGSDKFADLRKGITKVNESQFQVKRDTIKQVLGNPGKFKDGTKPIPNYKGGKINGFKLVGMKPGSVYYDLGIRPGDIITSVNGKPLNGPNAALELVSGVNTLKSVDIEVERNGSTRKLQYNIQ